MQNFLSTSDRRARKQSHKNREKMIVKVPFKKEKTTQVEEKNFERHKGTTYQHGLKHKIPGNNTVNTNAFVSFPKTNKFSSLRCILNILGKMACTNISIILQNLSTSLLDFLCCI